MWKAKLYDGMILNFNQGSMNRRESGNQSLGPRFEEIGAFCFRDFGVAKATTVY